jgi:hypothetical protein
MLGWALGGCPDSTAPAFSTRMARPWRIVGPLGPSASGLIAMARTAHVRLAHVTGTLAIIGLIISGHGKGRRKWCTVWYAGHPPCESRGQTFSPAAAWSLSMPRGWRGWDVVGWRGHRRWARPGAVPQRRAACKAPDNILLSAEAIERDRGRAHTRRAARQPAPERLSVASRESTSLELTIAGLQPAKGHATFAVVRELRGKRGWGAAPWLSRAPQEGRRVLAWARSVGGVLGPARAGVDVGHARGLRQGARRRV